MCVEVETYAKRMAKKANWKLKAPRWKVTLLLYIYT